MNAHDRRTAALLFGGELAAGTVARADLDRPAVRRAIGRSHTPSAPIRYLQRALMKAGALGYERSCARPMDAARRAVLGEQGAGAPRFLVRVDEFPHYMQLHDPERFGTEAFARFHAVLREQRVPYLIAALPTLAERPHDPAARGGRGLNHDEGRMLTRLAREDVSVGLHGYNHRTRRPGASHRSELGGLSARDLHTRLASGEAVLEQLGLPRPRVFVAPFNRFDTHQYAELAARYDVVCGGPESVRTVGFQRTPAWRGEAVYLPAYPPLYGTAAEVEPAVRALIAARRALWVPVVLHWSWEVDRGLGDLRRLAAALHGHAAHWDAFLSAVQESR
jgi:hypothetical protein